MPGIIQIGRVTAGEEGAGWTLQSAAGEARFEVTCRLRTAEAAAVERRLHEALLGDGIRHHEGFYFTPRRFAVQLLEREGVPVEVKSQHARKVVCGVLAVWLALGALGLGLLAHAPAKAAAAKHPAWRHARISMR